MKKIKRFKMRPNNKNNSDHPTISGVDTLEASVDKILLTGITRELMPSYTIGSHKVRINNTVICYYCEETNIFGRQLFPHNIGRVFKIDREKYYLITSYLESNNFERDTTYGPG